MSKTKLPLDQAQALAEKIVKELSPVCREIQVAGSIRRKRPEVGDIEIVAIPLTQIDLFGDPGGSLLDPELEYLIEEGRIIRGDRWGPKWKSFHPASKPEIKIDLFITTRKEWGYTFTIRTGSADFSHRIVTPKQQGGFLPGHLRVSECRVWDGATALDTSTEEAFFKALGLEWFPPEER